jgi:hypothetical protein
LSFSPLDPSVPSAYSLALKMLRFTAKTFTLGEEGEERKEGERGEGGWRGERERRAKSKEDEGR